MITIKWIILRSAHDEEYLKSFKQLYCKDDNGNCWRIVKSFDCGEFDKYLECL